MVDDTRNTFFKIVCNPVTLMMLVALGVCLLGSNAADRHSEAAKVPDVIKTYHNCEYLGKDYVMVDGGSVWTYLSTSCGRFNQPYKKYEWEKGKSYEIETTRSATNGVSISKIAPSP